MASFHRRSVEEHAASIAELLAGTLEPREEIVVLDDALGRVTTAPVASPVDLPLFRNSQMDGFAVRAAEVADAPVSLPVVGEVAARAGEPAALRPGTAVRIMTGAVVPEGADAVVPVEDTHPADTDPSAPAGVVVERSRLAGEYVRDRGSDVREGDELLPAGTLLASRHLAVLAAAGLATVTVRARVRVAVVTTGAELVAPGSDPGPGQVFDSNGPALVAAVHAVGAEVVVRESVADDHDDFRRALAAATASADLVVTSGGISMGDYEVVRETLEPLGADIGSVAMQPGGPQAVATVDGVPVVCFPGNPVSTQVSFEVFVAPLLRRAAGRPERVVSTRTLREDVRSVPGKRQFLRGRSDGAAVGLVSGPGSHLVAGLAAADVLVVVPETVLELQAGDQVETWEL
ncbi:molybdopterin molybdenumtransferase MoeA [Labedella phragmitis]|uniref:Molybdopterin molybdenumtransferase n=1 Tax=Labedella phragmitis TaxID=2498849 RepID=A0A3S4DH10_9MICO|nr:gephyrin-like molybdotransferase Glp [Labedella phragmitis]RWZ51501.1 molybdopterin molybdenumtransferase MoeA [Labedella phragmitis]